MKILFYGTAETSARVLKKLFDTGKHELEVITACDKPRGRGQKVNCCEVKGLAELLGLKYYQPENIKEPGFYEKLSGKAYDLGVVAAYGQIISEKLLKLPAAGTINLHFSLLPGYRGAAPYNWALINGEKSTGVTVMFVEKKLDSGDIVLQKEVPIAPEDNSGTLLEKLTEAGSGLLLEAVELIGQKKAVRIKQNETQATYFGKLPDSIFEIDWQKSALEINYLVRGLAPEPGAFSTLNGKLVKILKTSILSHGDFSGKPGEIKEIVKGRGLPVGTGKGGLLIERIKPEGKKEMSVIDYIRGNPILPGTVFERSK